MTTSPQNNPEIGESIIAGGITTNYHDVGQGSPVLLIHGSGPGVSAWANWRGVLSDLAREHRVLAPDIVGFGYTDRPAEFSYTREAWLAHLVAFLDALKLERVSVVGNSFGGALALAMAVQHPDRVDKLVLMGSVGVSSTIAPGLEAVWGFEPSPAAMREVMNTFAFDQTLVGDDLAEVRLAAATRPGVQESYARMFPAPRQQALDALDVPHSQLRGIHQPVLLVHGRDDRVIPLTNSLRLLELLPDVRLVVFGQCGHWVQIERRDEFLAAAMPFLAG